MIIRLKEELERAVERRDTGGYQLAEEDLSFKKAVNGVVNAIKGGYIHVVQGPPGTGKTEVAVRAFNEIHDVLNRGELVIYVAPTHELGVETLKRIVTTIGYDYEDVLDYVRIYGSRYDYRGCEKLGAPPGEETKLIITTEYQRMYFNFPVKALNMIIDEASRMPIHSPLRPIVNLMRAVLDEKRRLEGSLSVLGDPMQAIMVEPDFKRHLIITTILCFERKRNEKEYMCPRSLEDEKELIDWAYTTNINFFTFLEVTKRIPSPLHEPISVGFYNSRLKSKYSVEAKLKGVDVKSVRTGNSDIDEASKHVEEAITTGRGLILVRDSGIAYREGEFDPRRAKLALSYAIALAITTGLSVLLIAPYRDMVVQMRLAYKDKYRSYLRRGDVRISTVQRVLGGEADAIVAVLGKEYYSGHVAEDGWKTIYFMEPELLNVQLSREKKILVIVGDPERLSRNAKKADQGSRTSEYRSLQLTMNKLLELIEEDKGVLVKISK